MAEGATMQIDNQKNGMHGGTIHHDAIHTNHCPIQALACRVHHIMQHPNGSPDDIVSAYFTLKGTAKVLGASTITSSVKTAAKAIGLEKNGFPMTSVCSHSLRAQGAMAMHLKNVCGNTIQKAGHWSSDTFLMYIHE
jgi:hypothetical protein